MLKIQPSTTQIARRLVFVTSGTCLAISLLARAASAADQDAAHAKKIQTVFYIDMENHNWTQPTSGTSAPNPIFQNAPAPYFNRLATPANPAAKRRSHGTADH